MRIISWNVNGIRAVEKRDFTGWLSRESPDALCIQETKARPDQLSEELRNPRDKRGRPYHSYWASAKKPGYSGVAIYSREEPLELQPLGVDDFDGEGRVLQALYRDFVLISAYFPNSQDARARLPYKLAFCAAILEHCKKLVKKERSFILCGDYNIAHTPLDIARPKENEDSAGYLPEERAWMDSFTSAGFVDTFRHLHPGQGGHYSWWSYRANARARNVGWRLDYHCVDPAFLPRIKNSIIRKDVQGSDHCPVEIEIRDAKEKP
ncbi:MAG: exodeoxyribonuclease III [Spirochaetaceae bacterium]|jgi:exodeoxyribonuclease-3|nr:exodeoxyribonuclease III [Spirochaetaceae bacterium]